MAISGRHALYLKPILSHLERQNYIAPATAVGSMQGSQPEASQYTSLPGESSTSSARGADDLENARGKRKRARIKSSCISCQKRKTRCDQEDPCGACQKRGLAEECNFEMPDMNVNFANLLADMVAVKRRLSKLEKRFSSSFKEEDQASRQDLGGPMWLPADSNIVEKDTFQFHQSTLSQVDATGAPSFEGSAENVDETFSFHNLYTDRETQSAVAAIESMAFDKEQFPVLGISAPIPFNGRSNAQNQSHHSAPILLNPGSYTTIFQPTGPSVEDETSIFRSRGASEPLLAHLPDEALSQSLISFFFEEICWLYDVFHRPTFLDECKQLFDHVAAPSPHKRVDPAWLASYYIALAWAAMVLKHTANLPPAIQKLSRTQLHSLPGIWLSSFRESLAVSQWMERPQARVVQALLLYLNYRKPKDSESGAEHGASFYLYLSVIIRNCQLLNLHMLGSDHTKMPLDDPAWPRQACCLKRELAKRLWSFALSLDWLYCSGARVSQVSDGTFDTDDLCNLDDSDLGLHLVAMALPPDRLTDTSFTRLKMSVARFTMRVEKLKHACDGWIDYTSILELSKELEELLLHYNITEGSTSVPDPLHKRGFMVCMIYNKLLRLHRPYFVRSSGSDLYGHSRATCLKSASFISETLQSMHNASIEIKCFLCIYAVGAAIILFIHLLEQSDKTTLASNQLIGQLQGLRSFFEYGTDSSLPSELAHISKQSLTLLDMLLKFSGRQLVHSDVRQRLTNIAAVFGEIGKVYLPQSPAANDNQLTVNNTAPSEYTNIFDLNFLNLSQPPSPVDLVPDWNDLLPNTFEQFLRNLQDTNNSNISRPFVE